MNTFGMGSVVRLVNRVVDAEGKHVPVEVMVGGEAFWINDTIDLPIGPARIALQQTMYKMDPVTGELSYKLGCEALGVPTDPVAVAETQRDELIDRSLLPPDRRIGAKDRWGRTLQRVKIHNPIRRTEAMYVPSPRPNENGAFAGEYGERT